MAALGPIEAKMHAERAARERLEALALQPPPAPVELMPSWLRTDTLIQPPTYEIMDPEAPIDPREDN
jgi:hypothetical protein